MAGYYDRQDAVEDFDEYDPDPYNGGIDLAITYGRPISPSEDTCYPPSTPGHDEDSSGFDYGSESSPYGESHIDNERPTYGSGSVPSYERPRPKPKPAYDFESNAYGGEEEYGGKPSWNRPSPPPQEYHESGYGEKWKKPSYGYGEEEPQPPRFGSGGYGAEEEYGEKPRPSSSWNRPSPPPQEYNEPGYGEEWKKPSYGYVEEEPQHPKFGSSGYGAEEEYGEKPRPSSSWNRPSPPPQEYHQPGYVEEWRKPNYGYGEEETQPPKFGNTGYGAEEYGRPQRPSYYQQQEETPKFERPSYYQEQQQEETPKFERPTYYNPDQEEEYERPKYGDDHEKQKHGRHHHHHHHSNDDE